MEFFEKAVEKKDANRTRGQDGGSEPQNLQKTLMVVGEFG